MILTQDQIDTILEALRRQSRACWDLQWVENGGKA